MTVKDMLDLYDSLINDYKLKQRRIANKGNEPEAESFCAGVIAGFNNAYILLQNYEKEGLKPSTEDSHD